MSPALRLAAGLLGLVPALHGAGAVRQVTVAAAPVERAAQVVTLTLPQAFASGAILRDERGEVVPLQAEADLTARFIVARQAANQTLKFTLEAGRLPEQGNVQVVEEPSPPRPGNTPGIATATAPSRIQTKTGRLRVSVGGRPILYYQMDPDAVPREDIDPALRRAGYLHPVLTPLGRSVTEDYPAGDPAQHGIMTFWRDLKHKGDTLDFGNPKGRPERIEFGGIDRTWAGPVSGGFAAWHRWVESTDPGAALILNENWEVTAYALPPGLKNINIFDLMVSQTPAPGESFTIFPNQPGLRFRTPGDWSDSVWSTSQIDGQSARQTAGPLFSRQSPTGPNAAGIALLISKDSPISNALWLSQLMKPAPEDFEGFLRAAPLEIRSGKPLEMRQRIVVFDGPPDRALLEALWNGYTVPAVVMIAP